MCSALFVKKMRVLAKDKEEIKQISHSVLRDPSSLKRPWWHRRAGRTERKGTNADISWEERGWISHLSDEGFLLAGPPGKATPYRKAIREMAQKYPSWGSSHVMVIAGAPGATVVPGTEPTSLNGCWMNEWMNDSEWRILCIKVKPQKWNAIGPPVFSSLVALPQL